jgi:hypothetical protein
VARRTKDIQLTSLEWLLYSRDVLSKERMVMNVMITGNLMLDKNC